MLVNSDQLKNEVISYMKRGKINPVNITPEMIDYILLKFFHYSINSLLFGYPIIIAGIIRFNLVYFLHDILNKNIKKLIGFSKKAFGYSFYIVPESERYKEMGYIFRVNSQLMDRIYEQVETDVVYKLVR